jgi:hypothetical protein
MKISLLLFFSFVTSFFSISQELKNERIELEYLFNLPSHFNQCHKNGFNYGIGALISVKSSNVKLTLGGVYSQRNFSEVLATGANVLAKKYHVQYLDVPMYIGFNILSPENQKLYLTLGAAFNIPLKGIRTTEYDNANTVAEIFYFKKGMGTRLHLGVEYNYYFGSRVSVVVRPLIGYKVMLDTSGSMDESAKFHYDSGVEKFMVVLELGLKYSF